jgi:histidine triad (HIT) family protein
MSNESIFTKIINRQIPAQIIYEDDDTIAFNDIAPQAPIHILVVPKLEVPSLNVVDAKTIAALFTTVQKITVMLGLSETGYRTIINTGNDGGQTVPHLHIHIIGGATLGWNPS